MKTIQQDTLGTLVATGAVREFRVLRHEPQAGKSEGWMMQARIGSSWLNVRSRREPIRVWASLTAVGRFAQSQGIPQITIEL
ncbi:hypothetical protein KO950_004514 [Salmonella enterica]|nr:hypothetical protein [Salmonella enterica]